MRTYLVAALVVAIVACLSSGVSSAGYGYGGKGGAVYSHYRPPSFGYRYYRVPYRIGGSAYGYGGSAFGTGFGGGSYRAGGGFGLIWLLIILFVLFALLNDK